MTGQFARFLVVGTSNTLVTLTAYVLLLAAGLPYVAAAVPAFALGALNGYTLNRRWTFRAGPFGGARLARYALVQLGGVGMNGLLVAVLVDGLGAGPLLGQAISLPVLSATLFLGSRQWVFTEVARAGLPNLAAPDGAGRNLGGTL